MASKEPLPSARPSSHQRPSPSSQPSSSGLPSRPLHARAGSHSLLPASFHATSRVNRRKSVNTPGPSLAALTAAIAHTAQSATAARPNAASTTPYGTSLPSPPATVPDAARESAIVDDSHEGSADEASAKLHKARIRRASDGHALLCSDHKRGAGRIEVRCEKCGKGYKHSSCLTKHLWEHTPEWSYTSKLLISKHQQVQLLEAASVLVAMNGKESLSTPPDSSRDSASELGSASPVASGCSEPAERHSSANTTPPPTAEALHPALHRVPDLLHFRQSSYDKRPVSSGISATGQEDHELAAAVELLSCSFNSTSGSQDTVKLPLHTPPVPPVPVQYLDQAASLTSAGFINSYPSRQPESFTRGEARRGSAAEDVPMDDSGGDADDDDDDELSSDNRSKAQSDDDDGVFGRMEE